MITGREPLNEQKGEAVSNRIELRDATASDKTFLYELYADSRQAEMELWGWTMEQAEPFLRMQWEARRGSYASEFPGASDQIILFAEKAVGRCLIYTAADHKRIVDLALVEASRGQGIGTAILRRVQQDAASERLNLKLSVSKDNPARRLYERMGFRLTGSNEMYGFMEWVPDEMDDPKEGEY
ncbi:GNAT family N-acetyltransferase [Paenibacillus sp. 1P07SE]|uniref:GNAT family N-acetyltransferase n=1 Tax=Paenibacillus sp. 1P07SE TaxID=3132209 RepID=UPI0039A70386